MISKYITCSYINARSLLVVPNRNDYIEKVFGDDIVELSIGDDPILELNEIISIEHEDIKYNYKVNTIITHGDGGYIAQESVLNKCSYYIMPYVIQSKQNCGWNRHLYNCYLNDDLSSIFLIYRFSQSEYYLDLERVLSNNKYYVRTHDFDRDLVGFELKIPNRFKYDVVNFSKGKYSKISNMAKTRCISFANQREGHILHSVFERTEKKRIELEERLDVTLPEDSEVASIPREIEYIKHFKEKVI